MYTQTWMYACMILIFVQISSYVQARPCTQNSISMPEVQMVQPQRVVDREQKVNYFRDLKMLCLGKLYELSMTYISREKCTGGLIRDQGWAINCPKVRMRNWDCFRGPDLYS